MYERDIGEMLSKHADLPHYYGDYVRRLFVAVAVLLLVALPFYPDTFLFFSPVTGLLLVAALLLLAGITSPRKKLVIYADIACAFAGVFFFEYAAIINYEQELFAVSFVRQAVAILFAFAAYFSSKSLRGTMD